MLGRSAGPSRFAFSALLVLVGAAPALRAADKPLRETIDAEIQAAWKRKSIAPPGRAEEATFLRRVFIDLVGAIPTYDEASKFLQDAAADKRAKLIDGRPGVVVFRVKLMQVQ